MAKKLVFNERRKSLFGVFLALACALVMSSCSAKYRAVRDGNSNQNQPSNLVTGVPKDTMPTAAVEVIFQGQSVTRVITGQPFFVRPTAMTFDPDDVGVVQCANAGIVKADYSLGDGNSAPVQRANGSCTNLGMQYAFGRDGYYTISMTVTTDEGEQATAQIGVISLSSDTGVNGFRIDAIPLQARINQDIAFSSICGHQNPAITWDLGDGRTRQGAGFNDHYASPGSYVVKAQCAPAAGAVPSTPGNTPYTAQLTIVVTMNLLQGPPMEPPAVNITPTTTPVNPYPTNPYPTGTTINSPTTGQTGNCAPRCPCSCTCGCRTVYYPSGSYSLTDKSYENADDSYSFSNSGQTANE